MPSPITFSASFILIGLTIYAFDWVRRTFRTIVDEEMAATPETWGDKARTGQRPTQRDKIAPHLREGL